MKTTRYWLCVSLLAIASLVLSACGGDRSESKKESALAVDATTMSAEAVAEPTPPRPELGSNAVPGNNNLIINAAMEPDEKTGLPRGMTYYPDKSIAARVETDPQGNYALSVTKSGTGVVNFFNFYARAPVKGGAKYDAGFDYRLSKEYAGEVSLEAIFVPKESGNPVFCGGVAAGDVKSTETWATAKSVIDVPQGAREVHLLIPRVRDFKAGTITIRHPFVREKTK